ncbi:MAG: zinc ribbon domain-containing protein [bacterium]
MAKENKKFYYIYCPECQYRGQAEKRQSGGNAILEVILFLLFILPWIIYKLMFAQKFQCPKCGNPKVKRLASYYTRECPYCKKKITDRDPECPQCGKTLTGSRNYHKMQVKYTRPTRWK